MLQYGKLFPPCVQTVQVKLGMGDGFPRSGVGKEFTHWVDEQGPAPEFRFRVGTRSVYSHHVSLVLDGPCLEEGNPVVDSRLGPAGDHDK